MQSGTERTSVRARWVFPVDAAPLENGTVEIEGGRITAVHTSRDPLAVDLGNAAVIPGLVNAHTHLEFSDFAEPVVPASGRFTDWIRAVVGHRRKRETGPGSGSARGSRPRRLSDRGSPQAAGDLRSGDVARSGDRPQREGDLRSEKVARSGDRPQHEETVRSGLTECARSGTTLLSEVATEGWSPDHFPAAAPRAVVFRELIGLLPEQRTEQLETARRHLQESGVRGQKPTSAPNTLRGLSPHAPYSVHPKLFHDLVHLADEYDAPLAMHLAETRAELELLEHGTGEFVEMLREFDVWREDAISRGSRPLDYLRPLSRLRRALVIHGNYLADDEIDFLARHPHLALVYCPRTHAFFGHAAHPWRALLHRGGNVALGTDSRASNPDLSLWNELVFLRRRFPEIAPRTLLELGTIRGARALGTDGETGSLAPGKAADLAVIRLDADGGSDPYAVLFDHGREIGGTMRAGIWIAGAASVER